MASTLFSSSRVKNKETFASVLGGRTDNADDADANKCSEEETSLSELNVISDGRTEKVFSVEVASRLLNPNKLSISA